MCNSLDRNCDAKVCQRNDLGWIYIGIKWQEGREHWGMIMKNPFRFEPFVTKPYIISQKEKGLNRMSYLCIIKENEQNETNDVKMTIVLNTLEERLRQTFSEGGAQEIYREIKSEGNFLGFARRYVFDDDCMVARSALWGLTKASVNELSGLQEILNDLTDLAMRTENPTVRRLTLNIIERLKMDEDDLRTDFLDFCLEHMVSIKEYPGIQAVCMKLAYRMCAFYPELMGELKRTIEGMDLAFYTPAVKGLRNKILEGKPIDKWTKRK